MSSIPLKSSLSAPNQWYASDMETAWAVIRVIIRGTEGEGRNYAPGSFNIMSQLL